MSEIDYSNKQKEIKIMKQIEYECECESCKGTGIYVGFGEGDGVGVVCTKCKGKGWKKVVIEYKETNKQRKDRFDIEKVIESNPGIKVGLSLDIGGITYEEWKNGKKFEIGTEMRKYTCPSWWFQIVDYKKKPNWKECNILGKFSSCKHFGNKEKCWEKFDRENSIQ